MKKSRNFLLLCFYKLCRFLSLFLVFTQLRYLLNLAKYLRSFFIFFIRKKKQQLQTTYDILAIKFRQCIISRPSDFRSSLYK